MPLFKPLLPRPLPARSAIATLAGGAALVLALAGCATRGPSSMQRDGPPANPPADLMQVPDAVPALEPIRRGGPNKPYELRGQSYTPLPHDAELVETGLASWYGRKFHGRRTANGEVYNMYAMTAAHRTLPLPSFARVTNPANGRSVIVRVNDRGPFAKGRVIDLSYAAALKLGTLRRVTKVQVERITPEAIRNGSWSRDATPLDNDAPPMPLVQANAPTAASRGYWVQLGAYRERRGAETLQRQAGAAIADLAPLLTVFDEGDLYRVQAGPFDSRDEAQRTAERVREQLLLVPLLVERQ